MCETTVKLLSNYNRNDKIKPHTFHIKMSTRSCTAQSCESFRLKPEQAVSRCVCAYLFVSPKNWAAALVSPPAAAKQRWVQSSTPSSPAAQSTAVSSRQTGTFETHLHSHTQEHIWETHVHTRFMLHSEHVTSPGTFFLPKQWISSAGTSSTYLTWELFWVVYLPCIVRAGSLRRPHLCFCTATWSGWVRPVHGRVPVCQCSMQ